MQTDQHPTQPAPLVLLIDGNNLAHHLYSHLGPRQKMTPVDSRRLINHLASYAQTYPHDVQVELCLDRSPEDFDLPPDNLLVMHADYPHTGDGLLLARFWFHHLGGQACLVITNDAAILDEVAQAQGAALRVYDFVRRVGLVSPVFRAPDELPPVTPLAGDAPGNEPSQALSASIYFRIGEDNRRRGANKATPPPVVRLPEVASQPVRSRTGAAKPSPAQKPDQVQPPDLPGGRAKSPQTESTALPDRSAVQTPVAAPEAENTTGSAENEAGPYYFLSLETWPVGEGVRFLLHAFCPRHQVEYRDLIQSLDADHLRSADLRALAELLLHACGSEPDFAQHGALMMRVRLALLQAGGEPLSLEEIARRTGLKPLGLKGRIKEKAGRWIEILSL